MRGLRFVIFVFLFISISMSAYSRTPVEFKPDEYAPEKTKEWTPQKPLANDSSIGDDLIVRPADYEAGTKLSLSQLIDVSLQNNSQTRYAWAQARAKSAAWGTSRGEYYPSLDASAIGQAGEVPALYGGKSFVQLGASLDYLLFDFGGRGARVSSARQALIAANWNYNQVMSDIMRDVPQAYYTHIAKKAMVKAAQDSLLEATKSLEAAEARREAGAGTLSDVLLARAKQEDVKVSLARDRGDAQITKGRLAMTIGWPANAKFELENPPDRLPAEKIGKNVDELIELAQKERASINVSRANLMERESNLKAKKADPLPKLSGNGNYGWLRNRSLGDSTYYGGVSVEVPIFHGFSYKNAIRQARSEVESAKAMLKKDQEQVMLEVWSGYYDFKTAWEQLKSSDAMLKSASESYDASLERYKAGVADIVELLNAQSTLAEARAQLIDARMNLYNSYAELVHAVGGSATEVSDGRDIAKD